MILKTVKWSKKNKIDKKYLNKIIIYINVLKLAIVNISLRDFSIQRGGVTVFGLIAIII